MKGTRHFSKFTIRASLSIGMRSNKSADYRDCGFRHGEGGDFEETRRSFEEGT